MRIRKRVLAVGGALAVLVAGGYLTLWLAVPRDPLAVAYDRIEEGMTTEEAIAVVGRPPGSGGTVQHVSKGDPRWLDFAAWYGDESILEIESWEGRVVSKEYVSFRDDGFLDRCRRWLGLS